MLFVKGNAGTNIKLEFPTLSDISGSLINQAIIEMTYTTLPGDDPDIYPAPDQIYIMRDEGSVLVPIEDVNIAIARGNIGLFGGRPVDTEDENMVITTTYSFNISDYLQDILDGEVANEVMLSVIPRPTNASRGVFFGTDHATNPLKLRLLYSDVQ